jgi:type IX secretion system PorP/SprF family membrane protein
MSLFKEKGKNKYLGAGIYFFRDVAGDTKYSTTSANLSLSSIITLDGGHDLSVGLQGGFAQKSIDDNSFEWGSQFDGSAHNPGFESGESAVFEPYAFGDFSAGLSWSYAKERSTMSAGDEFYTSAGVAIYHANAPKLKYDAKPLDREVVIHCGAYVGIKNTPLALVPNVILMRQGPSTEVNVGGLVRYSIREESKYTGFLKETAFYFGAYSRLGDALIPTVVFELTSYSLGISYDIVNSDLQEAAGGKGGIEISFSFINPNPFKYGKGTRYRRRSLI